MTSHFLGTLRDGCLVSLDAFDDSDDSDVVETYTGPFGPRYGLSWTGFENFTRFLKLL